MGSYVFGSHQSRSRPRVIRILPNYSTSPDSYPRAVAAYFFFNIVSVFSNVWTKLICLIVLLLFVYPSPRSVSCGGASNHSSGEGNVNGNNGSHTFASLLPNFHNLVRSRCLLILLHKHSESSYWSEYIEQSLTLRLVRWSHCLTEYQVRLLP